MHCFEMCIQFRCIFESFGQVTQQATVAISAAGDEPKSWERGQYVVELLCLQGGKDVIE